MLGLKQQQIVESGPNQSQSNQIQPVILDKNSYTEKENPQVTEKVLQPIKIRSDPRHLFYEDVPSLGWVPLHIYMPFADELDRAMILKHGGLLSSHVECCTVQIYKPQT